jgi:hypothetical protein
MTGTRIGLVGGSIAIAAAVAYFYSEGIISAAGLVIGVFDLLVLAGFVTAALIESRRETVASIRSSIRAIRHRHATEATCGVCARFIVDNGNATFCPSCDLIGVA